MPLLVIYCILRKTSSSPTTSPSMTSSLVRHVVRADHCSSSMFMVMCALCQMHVWKKMKATLARWWSGTGMIRINTFSRRHGGRYTIQPRSMIDTVYMDDSTSMIKTVFTDD